MNDPSGHVHFLRAPLTRRLLGTAVALGAKSGTTDDVRDTWCAGVTPQYALGVWIGDPQGVQSVPADLYRDQAACRELGLLRELPHTVTALEVPAGITRVGGVAVPAPGADVRNPVLPSPDR
ncbi:hypothetical protein DEIPH_ctg009orf0038 [Deinococcus phoenicis]|uniref:Uncharacterized protein n=1 Tax=Deinococcus phoenicis TaxID=1476583 RepID=A0A016QT94_9DEIO|nr:hypothetical protein DEIPH_ctg009orf0038 [Deinococcus phoenicis]